MTNSRIPVTILTGFLGAGKTTLLNKLIAHNSDKKLAVIENEFGETSIDSDLVVGVENGIFELSNGCLCCSLNDDLIEVLQNLLKSSAKIDHLIVETTGIADPGPVAISFLADPEIQRNFRLDAIIALVDCLHIEQQLENQPEACKQVATADIVLLNKVDRSDPYQLDTVRNIIQRMNPQAKIFNCMYGNVEEVNLLNLNAFSKENVLETNFESAYNTRKTQKYSFNPSQATNNSLIQNSKVIQHSEIRSLSFVFPEQLDLLRFNIWIKIALTSSKSPLYRVKGILNIKGFKERMIFQGVNDQYAVEEGNSWQEGETKETKLVFIGKNLDQDYLSKCLKACISDKPFDPAEFYNEIVY